MTGTTLSITKPHLLECTTYHTLCTTYRMYLGMYVQVPSGWVVQNATARIVVPIGGQFGLIPVVK
jgi:hypothetical protein